MRTKVTVVGGAGFIGSHLVDLLLFKGYSVTVIDNWSTGQISNLKGKSVDFWNLDITGDPQRIAEIIEGSECIFHLAASTSVQESLDYPQLYVRNNVHGTSNLLEACRIAGIERVVFSSTSAIYGNTDFFPTSELVRPEPISGYALSKLVGEQYCEMYSRLYGIQTVCLRYFNVYGDRTNPKSSYRSVIPIFLDKFAAGESLPIVNDGKQARDFVHVSDVAKANLAALDCTRLHAVINIGSGKNYSVNQIAEIIGGKTESAGFRLEPKISLANINQAKSLIHWIPEVDLKDWLTYQIEQQKQTDRPL